ncbi:MAG: molybdenum cofactor biosynthesis protein MoaE [Dehalococcoidia bacterium]|nr:molybdenum cofactor biosynthesis protein MoaE [Dehalococcoidia bacterium]
MTVLLTHKPLEPEKLSALVQRPSNGATVTFLGVTRDHNDGRRVQYLEYEAYEEMAVQELRRVVDELKARWPVDVAVAHRLGKLDIGEVSLVVAVASAHRKEAFDACAEAVDRIKMTVPIWKREVYEGGYVWIGSEEHAEAKSPAG